MSGGAPSFKQSSDTVNHRSPPPLSDSAGRHAATTASKEETFSLVPGGDSPEFSMIIKVTPSLMDEMKRVVAEGGKARIKLDSNPDTSGGNIIEVGGKEFRFMWSREIGDLCDIYEECQSGEDGNGLLVESGCAWRKLNVQRILDESTKKHVKKMSEEAERKLRSRGTIVLEPGNPSMKSLVAVEAASQKNCNIKKAAALKKRSMKNFQELCIVGGSSKSTHTPGSSSRTAFKGKHSSPLSFIPDQPTASSPPLGAVNIFKITDEKGFNEDVDIMSIDEAKEPKHKTEASETQLAKQLERKITFKHGENRANPSENGKLKEVGAERAKKFGVRQDIELEGCSECNTRAPTNLLEEFAGRGKDPIIAVENNGDQMRESSDDDDDSPRYLKYEKNEPEFKEPIKTMAQYQEYVKEYNEKYPDYVSLLKNVEGFRNNFEQLCKDLEEAKDRDEGRYHEILGQIKETYERRVPHHKRLKMIFVVLHKELEHMKQMISDFANAQNKKNAQNMLPKICIQT